MLPIIAVDTQVYDPILGSTHKVIQSTETLGRLRQLNDSLVTFKSMRTRAIGDLQSLGTKAQQELTSDNLDIVKKTMKEGLSQIEMGVRQGKNLLDIYVKRIDSAKDAQELDKCISKLHKDTVSLLTFNLQKTKKGQNGPTHLVSYSRFSKKGLPNFRNYVVKWSSWNEICSWRLYDAISHLFPQKFSVPKTAALDFDKQVHENGDLASFSLEASAYLKQSFLDIVGESINTQDAQIMLMERVQGSNLFDFAENKYQYLSEEEKSDLFQKMGNLAMLDLLIGNTDRLIQTSYDADKKQYVLKDLTANLGNLMIDWFKGKFPNLYAIDNGVKIELIKDETEKVAYNQLIQKCEDINSVADMMIRSIKNSFQEHAEGLATSKEPQDQVIAKFEAILNDLQNSDAPKKALINGLEEMSRNFNYILLPFWNSDEALKLKDYLKDNYPALLDAVSERFQILNFKG